VDVPSASDEGWLGGKSDYFKEEVMIRSSIASRVTALAVIGLCFATSVQAAAIHYTLDDLGTVNPYVQGFTYLNQLSSSDAADFRAGSFDQWAHPAPNVPFDGGLTGYYDTQGDALMGGSRGWRNWLVPVTSNNLGQIVGRAEHAGYPLSFYYDPNQPAPSWQGSPAWAGKLQDIAGDVDSTVTGINDNGQIVGGITYASFLRQRPFIRDQDGVQVIHIDELGSQIGSSEAINQSGDVVGWYGIDDLDRAFLFTNGTVLDLNDLISATAGTILNNALGIDGSGRIVALGTDADGNAHEYLLTPQSQAVPEPTTLLFFGTVIGVAGVARVVRRLSARRDASV